MGVAPESAVEEAELLVDHRVVDDAPAELRHLRGPRKVAIEQEVADLEEVAALGQLFDGIATIEQDALVAVDEGNLAFAACRRHEGRVVREVAGFGVELANVEDGGPHGAFDPLERRRRAVRTVAKRNGVRRGRVLGRFRHGNTLARAVGGGANDLYPVVSGIRHPAPRRGHDDGSQKVELAGRARRDHLNEPNGNRHQAAHRRC